MLIDRGIDRDAYVFADFMCMLTTMVSGAELSYFINGQEFVFNKLYGHSTAADGSETFRMEYL